MSKLQKLIKTEKQQQQPPHIVVKARAGTGKTTTLIEGLKIVFGQQSHLTPSSQQQAVWDAMNESQNIQSACFVAFNKSIAGELKKRVPHQAEAMTCHSMGYSAVRAAIPSIKKVNSYRTTNLLCDAVIKRDYREVRKKKPELLSATEKLVGLCKMNLVDGNDRDLLMDLMLHYDIECDKDFEELIDVVPHVLELSKKAKYDIDFNDMIWLPVVLDLPVKKFDLLLIDEAQDLNRAQQALTKIAGRRLIYCGDDRQAIYGFAGADSDSLPRLFEELQETEQGCIELPLTVTRRCGKAIVEEAKKIVEDFEAHETNGEGKISYADYDEDSKDCYQHQVKSGDLILSRTNAPLVSQCLKFIRSGKKATIQGRDIGAGLVSIVKKMKANDIGDLIDKLADWKEKESQKESRKKFPSDSRLILIQDRYDCLMAFAEDCSTVDEIIEKIQKIFSDNGASGIKLSSIHRAKGLEADRVFLFQVKSVSAIVPHPMAKSKWQYDQELNLKYVATTRAIKELIIVTDSV